MYVTSVPKRLQRNHHTWDVRGCWHVPQLFVKRTKWLLSCLTIVTKTFVWILHSLSCSQLINNCHGSRFVNNKRYQGLYAMLILRVKRYSCLREWFMAISHRKFFLFHPLTAIGTIDDLGLACVCPLKCAYRFFSHQFHREWIIKKIPPATIPRPR